MACNEWSSGTDQRVDGHAEGGRGLAVAGTEERELSLSALERAYNTLDSGRGGGFDGRAERAAVVSSE